MNTTTPADTASAPDAADQAAPVAKAQAEHAAAKSVPARASATGSAEARTAPDAAKSRSATRDFAPATASVTPAPIVSTTPVVPREASPAPQATAVDNGALIGAGAAGLIGLAVMGGALVLRRRKRNGADGSASDENVTTPQVILPETSAVVAGAYRSPRTAPALAGTAFPAGSLDEMVADQPSSANPFLTRKNRLRRAAFLMQQEGGEAQATQPLAATAGPRRDSVGVREPVRTSVTYDFGKAGTRRSGWKPATT
jgi:hypothetical protein